MISVSEKKNCCGCAACAQACPKHCIAMRADEEGFWYPSVDLAQCVNCGLCEGVCPILHAGEKEQEIQAFAAYAADEGIRAKSSSGGLFTLLAKAVLKEGGVVFGAAFDEAFMVCHIAVESEEGLGRLQGSKYLQSRIEQSYQEAERALKAGRKVLFTGTACQIAGLKQFLGREDERLYTVDVLCHGVPSPKLWKAYLEYQKAGHGSALEQVSFRGKEFGWKNFAMKLRFRDTEEYIEIFQKDPYMRLFLANICLRPSCHVCKFKGVARPSDLTIGDSWGIERYLPDMDDDKGTSVVLVHSKKGMELFEACRAGAVYREAEVDKILPPTADSRKSVDIHPKRTELFRKLDKGCPIPEIVKLLRPSLLKRILRKCKRIVRK